MATRLLMIVALLTAAVGVEAQQEKQAPKRPAPAATERARPEPKNNEPKREQKAEPPKPEPSLEDRANDGDLEAQYQMGEQFRTSADAVLRSTALMWFGRAADQGHEGAKKRLAEMLKRYAPDESRAPNQPAAPPEPVPEDTSRETAALGMSVLALVASMAAIAFSWIRTRKALRDAGLL